MKGVAILMPLDSQGQILRLLETICYIKVVFSKAFISRVNFLFLNKHSLLGGG